MQTQRLLLPLQALKFTAIGLIALAVVAIGVTLWALRGDAIRAAERDAANIAHILAEQITRTVQELDGILNEFNTRTVAAGVISPEQFRQRFGSQALLDIMRERLAGLPQADFITVYDSTGRVLNSTRHEMTAGTDISDGDYFKHLRTHDDANLYVSGPLSSRITRAWMLFFSRRINGAFGDFVGGVTIGVNIKYFQRSYEAIDSLRDQAFLLLRRDGTALVRYPDPDFRSRRTIPEGSPWYDVVAQGGGLYRSPGYFQTRDARLVAVHPLRDYPLVANVGTLESAALATWKRRAILIAFGTLVAALCSALLLRALTTRSRALEKANLHLDAAVNNMSQGLCMFDNDQRLVVFNARYVEMYGLSEDAVRSGCAFIDVLKARAAGGTFSGSPDHFVATRKAQIAEGRRSYSTSELPDGRIVAVVAQPMPNGGWVATHEDITERQRSEERIAHMAQYDALTDLPNRILVREKMAEALADLKDTGKRFTVFIFDLDLFKAVNDSLGHPVGDALLKAIATRLQGCTDGRHTIGRLGGDEFAVIQTAERDQRQEAIGLAETLLRTICAPYEIDGHSIVIGISIGIALAPTDGEDAGRLQKNADLALYRAKSEGRNDYRFFEPEMDRDAQLQHALEIDLRNALMRDEFEIYYQLILDVASQKPCGAEALVRWRHPQLGLLSPDRFIPVAENMGFIIPLGEWILRKACMEAAKWPAQIKLAVNLSPHQFRSPRLVDVVSEALAGSGLAPGRLELEITESVLLQKDAENLRMLNRLGALGVSIVLDDFGTGYSSLSYLRLYAFNKIKIDKSFVAELSQRSDCAAIICAVTNLAQSLSIGTTAEGVETWEQFDLVRAAGCRQAQGFLFSRPAPACELDFAATQCDRTDEIAA